MDLKTVLGRVHRPSRAVVTAGMPMPMGPYISDTSPGTVTCDICTMDRLVHLPGKCPLCVRHRRPRCNQ